MPHVGASFLSWFGIYADRCCLWCCCLYGRGNLLRTRANRDVYRRTFLHHRPRFGVLFDRIARGYGVVGVLVPVPDLENSSLPVYWSLSTFSATLRSRTSSWAR